MNSNYQDYFGEDTKVYIFKCIKCGFEDPVPDWLIGEIIGFKKFIKQKNKTPELECPRCGKIMIPKDKIKN